MDDNVAMRVVFSPALLCVIAAWVILGFATYFRPRPPQAREVRRGRGWAWGGALHTLSIAILWGPRPEAPGLLLSVVAILLAAVSVAVMLACQRALGRQFAFQARLVEGHRLIVAGPYRYVRHPIYTALFGLALATGLPLLGINHLEAHIYSLFLLEETHPVHFPVLCLIVSGGHTELILMKDHGDYHRLGATLDDAAGEAFDKVARLLGLSYPGGPAIEQAARSGRADAYHLPRAMLEGTWDFSFSGLKTAMIRLVQRLQPETRPGMPPATGPLPLPDLAAAFQAAVVEVLVRKASLAARQFQATQLFVAGGVSANQTLRKSLEEAAPCPVRTPPAELCTDNAAMVAAAGCHRALAGEGDPLDIDVLPDWALGITAEGESIGQA